MPLMAILAAWGDIAILTHEAIDSLIRQGKAVGGSRLELARFVIGIAVRKGAGKPEISSPDTLPNQKSIEIP
jgi:molybdate transport system substrate-binding protein